MLNNKAVHRFRTQIGLSLARLASFSGMSEAMLCRFERGDRTLSRALMYRLERAIRDVVAGQEIKERFEEEMRILRCTKAPFSAD